MNNKLLKIRIILWGILAVVLIWLLVFSASKGIHFNEMNGPVTIQKEQTVSSDNINKINIDFLSSDIYVKTTDDANIKIVQKSTGKMKDNAKFTVSKNGDTLNVNHGANQIGFFFLGFGPLDNSVEIDIPKNYNKDLNIVSQSGNVILNSDMSLNSLSCYQSSGDFNSSFISNSNKTSIRASSGDIHINELDTNSYTVKDTSGDISIKSLSGTGKVSATSGNVSINYKDIADSSTASSMSGDVRLSVPKDLSFDFKGNCVSGDINSNFDLNYKNKKGNAAEGKVGNGPYKTINASVASGDIDINIQK